MFNLFVEGNPVFMSLMTVLLILVFVAAWKAPAWVKELGKMANLLGIFSFLLGLSQMCSFIQGSGSEMSSAVICGGLKVALIPIMYGMGIYFISLVIRLVQKPRI